MEVYYTLFREEELRAELRVSILGRFAPSCSRLRTEYRAARPQISALLCMQCVPA